jgi:Family of unknown function (DUF5675)
MEKTMSVTITITRRTYSSRSIISQIEVANSVGESFSGFTLENAAPPNPNLPVPPSSYAAFVRTDHDPNRIELRAVPNAADVQIHVGNTVNDVVGCFAVGSSTSADFVGGSRNAMAKLLQIISHDGSKDIEVQVVGSAKDV